MSEPSKTPPLLGEALKAELRELIREALRAELAATGQNGSGDLLDVEELAKRLNVPKSWVYEQSRLKIIPSVKIGRYLRFDFQKVLMSQTKKD